MFGAIAPKHRRSSPFVPVYCAVTLLGVIPPHSLESEILHAPFYVRHFLIRLCCFCFFISLCFGRACAPPQESGHDVSAGHHTLAQGARSLREGRHGLRESLSGALQ